MSSSCAFYQFLDFFVFRRLVLRCCCKDSNRGNYIPWILVAFHWMMIAFYDASVIRDGSAARPWDPLPSLMFLFHNSRVQFFRVCTFVLFLVGLSRVCRRCFVVYSSWRCFKLVIILTSFVLVLIATPLSLWEDGCLIYERDTLNGHVGSNCVYLVCGLCRIRGNSLTSPSSCFFLNTIFVGLGQSVVLRWIPYLR